MMQQPDSGTIEQFRDGLASAGETTRATLYNNTIDLYRALVRNALASDSASKPPNPARGQLRYDTDTKQLRVWDGTAWLTVWDNAEATLNPLMLMGG